MNPPSHTGIRESRFGWRQVLWRAAAFIVVFGSGFTGLLSGVEVSERDLAQVGAATKAYYALGLFVVGGLDLGTPHGGPLAGRALLWGAYFLAPVITASALLEAVLRMMAPLALRMRRLNDHVVIAGGGRLALLYLKKLRELDRGVTAVVVERNPAHPHLPELRDVYRAVVVTGDITSDEVLARLRIPRARRVMLLTGNDFSNLDAAAKILHRAPHLGPRTVCHVSDLGFLHTVIETSVARECETFNGREPVIVVGSGEDGTNLHNALTLIRQYPNAYIIARGFRPSPFSDEVSRDAGIHPFNISELVRQGMPRSWFLTR